MSVPNECDPRVQHARRHGIDFRTTPCEACNGTGYIPGQPRQCQHCQGYGYNLMATGLKPIEPNGWRDMKPTIADYSPSAATVEMDQSEIARNTRKLKAAQAAAEQHMLLVAAIKGLGLEQPELNIIQKALVHYHQSLANGASEAGQQGLFIIQDAYRAERISASRTLHNVKTIIERLVK